MNKPAEDSADLDGLPITLRYETFKGPRDFEAVLLDDPIKLGSGVEAQVIVPVTKAETLRELLAAHHFGLQAVCGKVAERVSLDAETHTFYLTEEQAGRLFRGGLDAAFEDLSSTFRSQSKVQKPKL